MLRYGMSGGNFCLSLGATVPGVWFSGTAAPVATAPAGAGDLFAWLGNNPQQRTPNLGGNFGELIAGYRVFLSTIANNQQMISFRDAAGQLQCELRTNGSGQLFFTRNGTPIGGVTSLALSTGVWAYIEFRAAFSTGGAGSCQVRVNGVSLLTSTGLTNATGSNAAAVAEFSGSSNTYIKDIYALDTGTGANVGFLGDIQVAELFDTGAGVHSQWTPNVGPFTLTSVNGAGVYQGTITGGAGNAYLGYNFTITGFANGANNLVTAKCTGSTATSLTFAGFTTVVETHAGSAAFDCIVQIGINQSGTRPNGDVAYIFDATTNDISDFAHQALTLRGVILGVVHLDYMRKDDLGTRQVAQVCLSGGSTEISPTISLSNTYQYYLDILEVDPNTGTQFGLTGLNATTFGVKEIT